MSFLFTLTEANFKTELPDIFAAAETDIQAAEPLFEIDGARLESLARDVPKHQAFYAQRSMELKAVMEWLETQKQRLEAEALRNLLRGARALGANDQKMLIAGSSEIVEINQVIIEATLFYRQLNEITDAFRQMGWMVGNITKLRVAELGDVII